ncbi:hypothetical protein M0R72_13455 [Candidatus Pacearchaeota archaeon]|nr:hypothetical protein [Candidatus Pacearchaeota archaeon]
MLVPVNFHVLVLTLCFPGGERPKAVTRNTRGEREGCRCCCRVHVEQRENTGSREVKDVAELELKLVQEVPVFIIQVVVGKVVDGL